MDYEQKYKEALERAKDMLSYKEVRKEDMEYLFPELKESEDEKIRKNCIHFLELQKSHHASTVEIEECIAWLEKQTEHLENYDDEDILQRFSFYSYKDEPNCIKHIENVESKFKVRDWCIDNEDGTIFQIVKVLDNTYRYKTNEGKDYSSTHYSLENDARLWTIQDAKDGDVLTDGKLIVIFNKLEEPAYRQHIIAYIGLDLCGRLQITEDTWQLGVDKAMPATKEQRDLLFQKMKEEGYEWDADKKELKKIQSKFHEGEWITFYGGKPFKILKIEAEVNGNLDYLLLNQNGHDDFYNKKYVDENARLWTIADAKDGDVLVNSKGNPFIFTGKFTTNYHNPTAYCGIGNEDKFIVCALNWRFHWAEKKEVTPATKEQRNLLFQRMEEAGYEWSSEHRKLIKME